MNTMLLFLIMITTIKVSKTKNLTAYVISSFHSDIALVSSRQENRLVMFEALTDKNVQTFF